MTAGSILNACARSSAPAAAHETLNKLAAATGADAGSDDLAHAFNIDPAVIENLRALADRGDPPPAEGERPAFYRGPEWQWLQEALVLLTRQAVSRASDAPVAERLALSDFRTTIS